MRKGINPLGRTVLAAALTAAMIGAAATAFAQDYDRGDYNHDHDRGWQAEHHEYRRPVYAYQPRYYAPPPVVYAAPPPQYAPPVDLFFSIGIH